jgi:hypothetical protein
LLKKHFEVLNMSKHLDEVEKGKKIKLKKLLAD